MNRIKHLTREPALLTLASFLAFAFFAALASCFFETKTNLCASSGIRCRPDQACAADQAACIAAGGCGDGIQTADEVCDDGNVRDMDGCSARCDSNETCGNGVLDDMVGEICDPAIPGTMNCSADCQLRSCGNNLLDVNEQCDSGATNAAGCDSDCTLPKCADGIFNMLAEHCDPPGGAESQGCDNDCTAPACGDRHTNLAFAPAPGGPFEACDAGQDTQNCNSSTGVNVLAHCQLPRCPDGYFNPKYKPPGSLSALEACDEGQNTELCNGGDASDGKGNCQLARCGDGYTNPAHKAEGAMGALEQCDSAGNTPTCNGSDNASGLGNCRTAKCGDGYRNPLHPTRSNVPEGCDKGSNTADCNGNDSDRDGVDDDDAADTNADGEGNCQTPSCGDGYINPENRLGPQDSLREQCDTMSTALNKGCGSGLHCDNSCQCVP